jgi:hypothetical protein
MSKFGILFMVGITTSFSLRGQCAERMYDIHTPAGSAVVTFFTCESSSSTRAYFDYYFAQERPNAEQIPTYDGYSSTRKFNCHGYAWLRVEQGIDRWIGTGRPDDIPDPEKIYITDGSYTEVSQETFPGKVFWASGDHTAITTGEPGWFISKWNEWPLFRHRWDDTPFGTTDLEYYVKTCPTINLTNQTITTDAIFATCGDINVQNVTVTNGAKLTLDAAGSVNIISDFEVELGSQLEIKGPVSYGPEM